MEKATIGVVGVPLNKGQAKGGTEQGPVALRDGGLIQELQKVGNNVIDHGDLNLDDFENIEDDVMHIVKNPRAVGRSNKLLADTVSWLTGDGQVALTLGGDHSLAVGSIYGHCQSRPDLIVIWVDAHADLNSSRTTISGNIHGMPMSFLMKEMKPFTEPVPGFEWCRPCLSAKDVVYIGLRDVDEAERVLMSELGIMSYSMQDVDRCGLKEIMDRILTTHDRWINRPIHVSFDVDSLDPMFAPSTGTPVPEGLTKREMLYIAEEVANTGRLWGLDVVEVNPSLGSRQDAVKTVQAAVDVVAHMFGKKREGNVSANYKLPEVKPTAEDLQ